MKIDVIEGQKWNVILGILQLAYHNLEINWRTGEVKIIRYSEKYKKQQRPKQGKLGWEKQKKEERKEEEGKKQEEKEEEEKKEETKSGKDNGG